MPKAAMSQRIVSAGPIQPTPDPLAALEELGRGWLILRNCRLGLPRGRSLSAALIHPAKGVALLDILPSESPGAIEAFRARLTAARFPAIFPGHLPVVHLRLAPRQLEELRTRLDRAFAEQPPLSLPGGDAWIAAVARALTTDPPVPWLRSHRLHLRHRRRRLVALSRLAAAALLAAGMLAAVYAATGTRQSPSPAAETSPAGDLPASAADKSLTPATEDIATAPSAPPPEATAAHDPVITTPATPLPPVPPDSPERHAATAPRAPQLLPPEQPILDHAARPGPAAVGGRATLPAPRPAPIVRRSEPESPPPRKEASPGKPAAFHPAPPSEAPEPVRLPPIAERVLPPIAAPQPPPEPPQQRCHRIVHLVGQGVLLPEEDLQFFQRACIRR